MPICEMSYSLDSTSKFFRQTVTTPVITTKKVCQSSALGTDGTILRTSISLHILERSSLSSAKECLVYLLYVVWSCYYQTSSFKNARFANWQDTPTRIIVTYSFMLQSVCQIPSSKKQRRLWQYPLRNVTNSLPFRASKVGTQMQWYLG